MTAWNEILPKCIHAQCITNISAMEKANSTMSSARRLVHNDLLDKWLVSNRCRVFPCLTCYCVFKSLRSPHGTICVHAICIVFVALIVKEEQGTILLTLTYTRAETGDTMEKLFLSSSIFLQTSSIQWNQTEKVIIRGMEQKVMHLVFVRHHTTRKYFIDTTE